LPGRLRDLEAATREACSLGPGRLPVLGKQPIDEHLRGVGTRCAVDKADATETRDHVEAERALGFERLEVQSEALLPEFPQDPGIQPSADGVDATCHRFDDLARVADDHEVLLEESAG